MELGELSMVLVLMILELPWFLTQINLCGLKFLGKKGISVDQLKWEVTEEGTLVTMPFSFVASLQIH